MSTFGWRTNIVEKPIDKQRDRNFEERLFLGLFLVQCGFINLLLRVAILYEPKL